MVLVFLCTFAGNNSENTKPQMMTSTSTTIYRKGCTAILYIIICALLPLRSYSSTLTSLGILTTEDGLSSNSVKTIYRDKTGYVYFGTSSCLDRYDGARMISIPFPIETIREKCWVSGIVEAGDDKLYVGNNVGLFLFDKRTLDMKQVFNDKIDCEVTSLVRTPDGKVYVGTVSGLFVINEGKMEMVKLGLIGGFTERNIRDVSYLPRQGKLSDNQSSNYILCAVTTRSLLLLPNGEATGGRVYAKPASCSNSRFVKVVAEDGIVYVGTSGNGVQLFDIASRTFLSPLLPGNVITCMQATPGRLYVGTDENGLLALSTEKDKQGYRNYAIQKQYTPKYIGIDDKVCTPTRHYGPFSFLHDDMGVDWIGYLFFGIDYTPYSYKTFRKYNVPGLADDEPFSVQYIHDDDTRRFICTRNGLYVVNEKTRTTRHIGSYLLGTKMVSWLTPLDDGFLVATVGNGVVFLDGSTLKPRLIKGQEALLDSYVYMIVDDRNGHLWMATTKGAACYDRATKSIKVYTSKNSQLPDDEVFCLNFDNNGRGWLSTRGGLCCYDPMSSSIITANMPKVLLELGEMRNITRWKDGTMCFLPQHGFPVIADASMSSFRTLSFDIQEDAVAMSFFIRHGDMYVFCTEKGLYTVTNGQCRFHGHLAAVGGVNMSGKAPYVDRKGVLWLPTNEGVFTASISELKRTDYPHLPIVVSEIQNDHWFTDSEVSAVAHDNRLRLSRRSSDIGLRFSPLVYGNIRDIRYRYRIEGVDDEWHNTDNNRTIFYRNLPFGNHRLRIEVLGMPEISADIEVEVPLTYTAINYAIILFLVLLLVGHVVYCKVRKKEYIWKRFLPKPVKYQTSRIDPKEGERLTKALVALMNEKKPYLDANIQMSDFARMLGCSTHTLSQVFTLFIKRNYYDFISEYRIEEFKRLSRDPKYAKYTITALSNQCGFRSRTPFLVAFKKFTGMTPKEWMKGEK